VRRADAKRRRATGSTNIPIEKPVASEKTASAVIATVATTVGNVPLVEHLAWSATSVIPATRATPRSSSTIHQPFTAKRV
jgi:hypothetical protein